MEKQLLDLFLDLYTYDDNISLWSFDTFEDNPPRYYRLKMIAALMKALEINYSYSELSQGKFISNKQVEKWAAFKNSIETILSQDKVYNDSRFVTDASDITNIFRTLMRYRLYAQQLLSSNDCIYAASGEFRVFLELMNTPSQQLVEELKKIDSVLLFCLNPLGISYTKEELMNQFGFPNVNLREVDIEWM